MTIRKGPLIVMLAALSLVAAIQLARQITGPRYWLNLSNSEPVGIYKMEPHLDALRRGEMVVMNCPAGYDKYLYGRKWLPHGWPLIKSVGALAGDTYCVTDKMLSVKASRIGPVFRFDSRNLPLPIIRGCRTVSQGHFLPIATGLVNSFDGRYFGDVPESLVIGKVRPLLTFP